MADKAQGRAQDPEQDNITTDLVPQQATHPRSVDKDGEARTSDEADEGGTGHFGAVESDVVDTGTPVPGTAGDPAGVDPTLETPGG